MTLYSLEFKLIFKSMICHFQHFSVCVQAYDRAHVEDFCSNMLCMRLYMCFVVALRLNPVKTAPIDACELAAYA